MRGDRKMKVLEPNLENLKFAGEKIKEGKLVAIPTETVYGLGADAFNTEAVAKIFEAKKRPFFDPLIVHIADRDMLDKIAFVEGEKAEKMIKRFWPGPVTMIFKKKECVPDIITSGLDSVAVRMPSNKYALEIIKNSTGAVAAPSANPFGYLSPTTAQHVADQLGDSVDYVVDGGKCIVGVESTIIDMTKEIPMVLRPGGLDPALIEEEIGKIEIFNRSVATPTAPGQLPSHYAPRVPLFIVEDFESVKYVKNKAALLLKSSDTDIEFDKIEILSERGNLVEAASNLFEALHRLDKSGVDVIYTKRVSDMGIGKAINDRLYKASKK